MQKDFYFNFKKVGIKRNKMLFVFSSCSEKTKKQIYRKYGQAFYISLIKV